SHEEGGERQWSVLTKCFIGRGGHLKGLQCVRVDFIKEPGQDCLTMKEVPGSEFQIEADVAILAIGYLHPEHSGLLTDLGLEFAKSGNVKTDEKYMSSVEKVFCAGDMRRGQSLVVWAISEGRRCAHNIDKYLMGETNLPSI
ncbi:MAG: FAD-dependent oxidoreductase, partial [Candidatus Omnitrophica bacterium]|nr:FAD-dependent oxidoreductase [Candidatus Omnitrophota bacterium]